MELGVAAALTGLNCTPVMISSAARSTVNMRLEEIARFDHAPRAAP